MSRANLENLARIGRLQPHTTDRREIAKLLEASGRHLEDARNTGLSNGSRLTCAYTAIMQAAQAALFANGYRPSTSAGGHHMTMVQALVHTIGLDGARMQALDTIRRKRNVIDYTGDEAEPSEVEDAIVAGEALLGDVRAWLTENRPQLV